jgi:hypothetical protein
MSNANQVQNNKSNFEDYLSFAYGISGDFQSNITA